MLNAWRRQRILNRTHVRPRHPRRRMLNAWRRQRILNLANEAKRPPFIYAQRLAASEDSQHSEPGSRGFAVTCSTPGGVRGFSTDIDLAQAIGRQLCSTPGGVRGFSTVGGRRRRVHVRPMLNAWRRQRILNDQRAVVSDLDGAMLNAWRRQRILNGGQGGDVHRLGACSTPGGVRGFSTLRVP